MSFKIGIDVGGTFTDFLVAGDGVEPRIHKVLSTPDDPSIAFVNGLTQIAETMEPPQTLENFVKLIDTIVHGTTVTTNAALTDNGAKMGLITTSGVRDALEMRRGVREEQYNNRFTNVPPLVKRRLRVGVDGRLDRDGKELSALDLEQVDEAISLFRDAGVEAVVICFMNAFANAAHEQAAARRVREQWPEVYLTVSTDLLPSIRFYERISTTALNSYVGPILNRYLDRLQAGLHNIGFEGLLLIMQSNGGVISPALARQQAALTLLSGPAAGPGAGLEYARAHAQNRCITVDMGGTSFDAALVIDSPLTVNEGEINRHRFALPMLGIHTIGSGGGSIGWLDEGGLLRMGPQSAGADPGPACYGRGGTLPATTDANLVLGYLDPDFFAGGQMVLDLAAARQAIDEHIAKPLGMSIEQAAAGMYRVSCINMAQGVREITIKRGSDPREFPMVVAGGAGPVHSCAICQELQIPLQIVPRESSIFCAAGMLMVDLKHDFVRTFVANLERVEWPRLAALVAEMKKEGGALLEEEQIPESRRRYHVKFDCRYLKQYHEVSFEVEESLIAEGDHQTIATLFHGEHSRLYGYELAELEVAVEIINLRVQAVGVTEKPQRASEPFTGSDSDHALKGTRQVYVPELDRFDEVRIYDGHRLQHGNQVVGPAVIEQVTTSIFVSADFDCYCDHFGSFVIYTRGREDLVNRDGEGKQ